MSKIKITGHTAEQFQENLKRVLTTATLVCCNGYVPTPEDIADAATGGKWYIKEAVNCYSLLPIGNNYKFYISEEDDTMTIGEFHVRYDATENARKDTLTHLLAAWFDCVEIVN